MFETLPSCGGSRRFGDLRGVRWRMDMGILPASPSATVDDLRQVTANSRRSYASLRRKLLVDPHVPKDGGTSPDLVMDNPLSQNPDSMWGRFFRNAELERMVDQDLMRLYPERGGYFQTSGCQGMLRRILLLWCLKHPECGYRQGMHELLAPLLYVLHVDVERLAEVRKNYDDHFADKFDGFSFYENDLTYRFDFKKISERLDNGNGSGSNSSKARSPSKLDPEIQMIILLSDVYGVEGELGIVLSEKFMEHDAYCMFDALMNGAGGTVSMSQFFSPSVVGSSHTGFPPVIEASAALYHLLSIVDSSLHSHLVELGVEPQYFALRWLRLLFGREFSLDDLLVIWDEIFEHENTKPNNDAGVNFESNFGVLESPRGAFICSFAVSMMLNLRSSLLATEHATTCLQRLLNFPEDVKLEKLLKKANSLIALAEDANNAKSLPFHPGLYVGAETVISTSISLDSTTPQTPLHTVPHSYWEEKWRVHHSEEAKRELDSAEQVPNRRKGWSERIRIRLSRTESDPSPLMGKGRTKVPKPSVRRSLLEDLARHLGSEEDEKNEVCELISDHQDPLEVNITDQTSSSTISSAGSEKCAFNLSFSFTPICENNDCQNEVGEAISDHQDLLEVNREDVANQNRSSGAGSEKSALNFSFPTSPVCENSDCENEPEINSSVASYSSLDENGAESCGSNSECSHLPVSNTPDSISSKCTEIDNPAGNATAMKEQKPPFSKFQWLWKFGRNAAGEGTSHDEGAKKSNSKRNESNVDGVSTADNSSKGETVDQNLMVSLKNLGQTMLENIQVIESVFHQDRGQTLENLSKNVLVGKGQGTAVAALKELRKISNLLSEM